MLKRSCEAVRQIAGAVKPIWRLLLHRTGMCLFAQTTLALACLSLPDATWSAKLSGNWKPRTTRSLLLKVTVNTESGPHEEIIIYSTPNRWKVLVDIAESRSVALCDGHIAWQYDLIKGQIPDRIRKWELDRLKKFHPQGWLFENLRVDALSGLATIAIPLGNGMWKEFDAPGWRREFRYCREDKVGTLTRVVYESKQTPRIRVWFGRDDGILRQQIVYDQSGKEKIKAIVTALHPKLEIADWEFTWVPPPMSVVEDETDKLFLQLLLPFLNPAVM